MARFPYTQSVLAAPVSGCGILDLMKGVYFFKSHAFTMCVWRALLRLNARVQAPKEPANGNIWTLLGGLVLSRTLGDDYWYAQQEARITARKERVAGVKKQS